MNVTVRYHAQIRQAAGRAWEAVEVPDGTTLKGLLAVVAERTASLGALLLDEDGNAKPSLLTFVGDRQARGDEVLHDGDEVLLLLPIAGGAA